jgi:hypothetical protein
MKKTGSASYFTDIDSFKDYVSRGILVSEEMLI